MHSVFGCPLLDDISQNVWKRCRAYLFYHERNPESCVLCLCSKACPVLPSLAHLVLLGRMFVLNTSSDRCCTTTNLAAQRSCGGLFVMGGASWWQLPLSINTPLPLSSGMTKGLHALMDAATTLPGEWKWFVFKVLVD